MQIFFVQDVKCSRSFFNVPFKMVLRSALRAGMKIVRTIFSAKGGLMSTWLEVDYFAILRPYHFWC